MYKLNWQKIEPLSIQLQTLCALSLYEYESNNKDTSISTNYHYQNPDISWEGKTVTKSGFTLIKIMLEGTPSRITSHGIRLTKIHIFVRVYRHELFSWEFTVTATLMKIMLLPGLHTCFHGGFLWYFVRVHRHEWISWDLCYFVRVRRHEWISWELRYFVRVHLHEWFW